MCHPEPTPRPKPYRGYVLTLAGQTHRPPHSKARWAVAVHYATGPDISWHTTKTSAEWEGGLACLLAANHKPRPTVTVEKLTKVEVAQ